LAASKSQAAKPPAGRPGSSKRDASVIKSRGREIYDQKAWGARGAGARPTAMPAAASRATKTDHPGSEGGKETKK
jgi:hypothetical protein